MSTLREELMEAIQKSGRETALQHLRAAFDEKDVPEQMRKLDVLFVHMTTNITPIKEDLYRGYAAWFERMSIL